MDEIGRFIKATPSLLYTMVADPVLWFKLVFGCWTPHQYRLVGPDAWSKARNEIMLVNSGYDYRLWKGLKE
jgi:dimethylaniline monooxygenase (N-oxide forming)